MVRKYTQLGSLVILASVASASHANVWVFEPSAAIDQRFDDNYTIDPYLPDKISATRLVGSVGLSRVAAATSFTGMARIDGLITASSENDNELSSNQILFLESKYNGERSSFGLGLSFKRDTPSRDISADLTDLAATASDTGASVTQSENVARQRYVINPSWQYNWSRRTILEGDFSFTQVNHDLATPEEAVLRQWLLAHPGEEPPADLSIETLNVFTVANELDDYQETKMSVGSRFKFSPIDTITFSVGLSHFAAETEPHANVVVAFEDLIPDKDERRILRKPKRQTSSDTTTVRVGYERSLSQTLTIGAQVGVYNSRTDDTDLLRETDATSFSSEELRQAALDSRISTQQGYLANITASKSTGVTRYSGKFGVDVLPSDVGTQVESLEAIGDLVRELTPLMDFSFRMRAYEPDALNPTGNSKFTRRFFSMEPKLIWRFNRSWTAAASYRYRRQKSRADTISGDSNAILFSLKFTPPSAIRDAQEGGS